MCPRLIVEGQLWLMQSNKTGFPDTNALKNSVYVQIFFAISLHLKSSHL